MKGGSGGLAPRLLTLDLYKCCLTSVIGRCDCVYTSFSLGMGHENAARVEDAIENNYQYEEKLK